MVKASLAALAGAVALALNGVGHAAFVPLEQSLQLHAPGPSLVIDSGGGGHGPGYYELVVDPSWTEPTRFTAFHAGPAGGAVSYALYADFDVATAASDTGRLLARWSQA